MLWRNPRTIVPLFAVILATLGMSACDETSSAVEPEGEEDAILAVMEETIQDEYKAELTYQKVLDTFGSVVPFKNIINAEVRHSEAIGRLYAARGLPVPASRWEPEDIPAFSSVTAACQAGVVAEIDNVEIYDRSFGLPLPEDVRFIFENNRAASLERHLPAFQRCS